jgi:hypothetical protein
MMVSSVCCDLGSRFLRFPEFRRSIQQAVVRIVFRLEILAKIVSETVWIAALSVFEKSLFISCPSLSPVISLRPVSDADSSAAKGYKTE